MGVAGLCFGGDHSMRPRSTLGIAFAGLNGCARKQDVVDDEALRAADTDSANWITYGRTYSEQRYSPLKEIDEQSVGKLGLVWSYDMGVKRALESTPLVKDGVMYVTSAWSLVYAMDAKTGKLLWKYDPKVAKDHAKFVCCDVVNRGVAMYKGHLFLGALDGRLISLDAKTGTVTLGSANHAERFAICHHGGAAHCEGTGDYRQCGIGICGAWLRVRV